MQTPALADRTVVIIGGTTGLGLAAARACAAAGAQVIACGRNADSVARARQELGAAARVFVGDAADPATGEAAIALALQETGRFDALYHVAGGSGRGFGDGPLHEISDDAVDATLKLNLASVIYSNRAAVRSFLERGVAGSVLNMSSVLATNPSPQYFATHVYAAAKSAIIGFTKSCAAYYAPRGIRFNVVAPALVDTPMAQRAVGNEAIGRYIQAKQPLDGGRVGRPEDLDAAVVYFLSGQSRYVTGQVLAVDGGWSVSEGGAADE
jgi:NAD(P)-dependent dehydrogenase (short-subunit alcohol dehydrogenase family)